MTEDRSVAEILQQLRVDTKGNYEKAMTNINHMEETINALVEHIKEIGIVVVERNLANYYKDRIGLNIFTYLEKELRKVGRKYIKCVKVGPQMIYVTVPNDPFSIGLVANLHMHAVPKPGLAPEYNTRKARWRNSIEYLCMWTEGKKKTTFLFNGVKGMEIYDSWVELVTTQPDMRQRLGLPPKKET